MKKTTKNLKILEVLDSYYPKVDGPHSVITFYAEILNSYDGVSAEVVVPKTKNYFDVQKFVVRRVKSLPAVEGYEMACAAFDQKLKNFLKRTKVDLIHIHSPFTLGRFFVRWGKKHNVPTVCTFHTAYKEDFERILKLKWQQNFMMKYIMKTVNLADHVLTVSNGACEVLRSYGYEKPIEVVRNGTDFEYPANAKTLQKSVQEKHGLADDDLVFLSVGRVVENKRLDVVVEALDKVKKKGLKFRFFVVGDGPYRQALQAKVQDLGLEKEVEFLGRLPERADIVPYYLRANLLLFPSTFDTASLAPIEAAALKLPTMLTRGAPTAEIVEDGRNGFLAGQDADDWADRIWEVCQNRDALEAVREVCFREVNNPWSAVVEELFGKYRAYMAEKASNQPAKTLKKSCKG